MKQRIYIRPEASEIVLDAKDDILSTSGYTQFSLFGTDGVGDDSGLDRVIWGQ